MLETEIKYFEDNLKEWLEKYSGQHVLVKGEELKGVFPTFDEALTEGAALYGLDSFLIRRVAEPEGDLFIPTLSLGLLDANIQSSVSR